MECWVENSSKAWQPREPSWLHKRLNNYTPGITKASRKLVKQEPIMELIEWQCGALPWITRFFPFLTEPQAFSTSDSCASLFMEAWSSTLIIIKNGGTEQSGIQRRNLNSHNVVSSGRNPGNIIHRVSWTPRIKYWTKVKRAEPGSNLDWITGMSYGHLSEVKWDNALNSEEHDWTKGDSAHSFPIRYFRCQD